MNLNKNRALSIFSKYNKGVRISDKMRYSVTREKIADRIAEMAIQMGVEGVVDGCGGAGGNSIAFARAGFPVAYVELDDQNVEDAQHNAEIYGVRDAIWFYSGDILEFNCETAAELDPSTTLFFCSPEWGGPAYKHSEVFDINNCNPPVQELLDYAQSQRYFRAGFYLPRTSNIEQLKAIGSTEINYMFLKGRCDAICAWFEPQTTIFP